MSVATTRGDLGARSTKMCAVPRPLVVIRITMGIAHERDPLANMTIVVSVDLLYQMWM